MIDTEVNAGVIRSNKLEIRVLRKSVNIFTAISVMPFKDFFHYQAAKKPFYASVFKGLSEDELV